MLSTPDRVSERSIQTIVVPYLDEEVDQELANVTLTLPRTPEELYNEDQLGKSKDSNSKGSKRNSKTPSKEVLLKNFEALSEEEKKKYIELSNKDKERYDNEIFLVEKYLVRPYYKEGATAQDLFINNYINEKKFHSKQLIDLSTVEMEAEKKWKKLSNVDKIKWKEIKEKNDEWWKNSKKNAVLNTFDYFCIQKFKQAEDMNYELTVSDCVHLWRRLSEKKLEKYEKEADEENEKRKERRDILELSENKISSKVKNSYAHFSSSVSKAIREGGKLEEEYCKFLELHNPNEEFIYPDSFNQSFNKSNGSSSRKSNSGKKTSKRKSTFFSFVSELWSRMSEEDKDKYRSMAHKEELLHIYRKRKLKEKKKSLKANPAETDKVEKYFYQLHKDDPVPEGKKPEEYLKEVWKGISESSKKIVEEEYNKETKGKTTTILKTPYQFFFEEKLMQKNEGNI